MQVTGGGGGGGEPSGTVKIYAGAVAPSGYLLCDGAALSVATYAALFAAIGYTWGGAGASFNIPDLRTRQPVGADGGLNLNLGDTDGQPFGSRVPFPGDVPANVNSDVVFVLNSAIGSPDVSTGVSGRNHAHSINYPGFTGVNFIIKT